MLPVCEITPSAENVRAALEQVLASREFVLSERLSRFLRFVVEKQLKGETDSIKEAVIGSMVFDRPPGYDPKVEPIVRVEAYRLRGKLKAYYENSGKTDPIRIELPKGSYVPVFRVVEEASADSAARKVSGIEFRKWVAVCGALLFAVGSGIWFWRTRHAPAPPAPLAQKPVVVVTDFQGEELSPSLAPDGSRVAFSWNGDSAENFDIYIRALDGGAPRRLTTDSSDDLDPRWSPDNRWIAFRRKSAEGSAVWLVAPDGGQEQKIAESVNGLWGWTSDGRYLAVTVRDESAQLGRLDLLSAETGTRTPLTNPPSGSEDVQAAFSPDGKWLAFARCRGSCAFYVAAFKKDETLAGAPQLVFELHGSAAGLAWALDGRELIFGGAGRPGLWRLPVNRDWTSDRLTPQAVSGAVDGASWPTLARRGEHEILVFQYGPVHDIWRVELREGNYDVDSRPVPLLVSKKRTRCPQYSPDGKSIAYIAESGESWDLFVMNADGTNSRQLTTLALEMGGPRWSPDGKLIAFDAFLDDWKVFLIPASGGEPQQLTRQGSCGRSVWSRDGKALYFACDEHGIWQLWKMPSLGAKPIRLTSHGGMEVAESQDLQHLYMVKRDIAGLWLLPAGGGPETLLLPNVNEGFWDMTDKGIYFVDVSQQPAHYWESHVPKTIYFYSFETKTARQVATLRKQLIWETPSVSVRRDGRWLIFCERFEGRNDTDLRMISDLR